MEFTNPTNHPLIMKKDIIELFKLKGVIFDKQEIISDSKAVLYVRSPRTTAHCPECGTSTKRIHDKRRRNIKHGKLEGRDIVLSLLVRRFVCSKCRKRFTEKPPPGIDKKRSTKQFRDKTIDSLKDRSFKSVATEYNSTVPTLTKYLQERYAIAVDENFWPQNEDIVLSVDEQSYSKKNMKLSLAMPSHDRVLEVLPKASKTRFEQFLREIPVSVKPNIKEVTMDLTSGYRYAVLEELPNANIVADHFHVIRCILDHLDRTRRIVQEVGPRGHRRIPKFLLVKNREKLTAGEKEKLQEVFSVYRNFSALEQCYRVKERLRDIYEIRDRKEAELAFDTLLSSLSREDIGVLKDIRATLLRWRTPILNYFNNRSSNGYMEGCHTKFKTTKRISYGFRSFPNYVIKTTLAFAPQLFREEIPQ